MGAGYRTIRTCIWERVNLHLKCHLATIFNLFISRKFHFSGKFSTLLKFSSPLVIYVYLKYRCFFSPNGSVFYLFIFTKLSSASFPDPKLRIARLTDKLY